MTRAFTPQAFLAVAREAFAPVYPYYAAWFRRHCGITTGLCLDIGTGCGDLGLAVAAITDLDILLLDASPEMAAAAGQNAADRGLASRAAALVGDVQALPLADAAVDLAVSRGSLMFWDDLAGAFREIRRVLKPSGRAYLGGGLGPPAMRQTIIREMARRDPAWSPDRPHDRPPRGPEAYAAGLRAADVDRFAVENGDTAPGWSSAGKTAALA